MASDLASVLQAASLHWTLRSGVASPWGSRIVYVGAPGSGKTTTLAYQAYRWAAEHGIKVLYLSRDQGIEAILDRWAQCHGLARDTPPGEAGAALQELGLYVADAFDQELLREFCALEGDLVIALDSIHAFAELGDATVQITALLRQLDQLAAKGVTVIATSHAQKGTRVPTLASCKDAATIEHFADLVVGFWKNKVYMLKTARLGSGEQSNFQVEYKDAKVTEVSGVARPILSADEKVTSLEGRILALIQKNQYKKVAPLKADLGGATDEFYNARIAPT